MCGAALEAQSRVIEPMKKEPEMRMTLPEAFLEVDAAYRQRQVAEDFARHARGRRPRKTGQRRHWVPRRPHLQLPTRRRRPLAVA
jgi:hypothetical protein